MKKDYYRVLIERYLNREATKTELELFFKLLSQGKLDSHLKVQMDLDLIEPKEKNLSFVKRHYGSISAAAIILIMITVSSLFYLNRNNIPNVVNELVVTESNQAVLILSDGQEVSLAENKNRSISEGNIDVITKDNGLIIYDSSKVKSLSKQSDLKLKYNTIKTSHSRTFQVLLPDGSKVWLNSLSSITFPLEFDSLKRVVTMEGEVYFDVLHANSIPFVVSHKGQEIHVLGTQFNVNSYTDEPAIRTTLVEGSIFIKTEKNQVKLVPGEQSVIKKNNTDIEVLEVDLKTVIAWKEGYFRFDHADLQALIRQISRWYNLEVVFAGNPNSDEFTGRIKRSENLEEVIKSIKLM